MQMKMQIIKFTGTSRNLATLTLAAVAMLSLGVSLVGASAFADSSSSKSSNSVASNSGITNVTKASVANEVEKEKEKAALKKNDVDKLITNNELRAESGSKRKLSISTAFSYYGGTLASPLSKNRPNILQSAATTPRAYLGGSVAVQYNMDETNSVSAGTGIRFIDPLQGGPGAGYNGTSFDAENPYVQYQNIANFHGVQSVAVAQLMQWTQADQTPYGYAQEYSLTETAMYAIRKFSVGAYISAADNTFDKHGSAVEGYQSDYSFDLSPILEYQFTPKVNFRTVANSWIFQHNVGVASDTYQELPWEESIGIGYSVSRNMFLYPNVQFIPEHLATALTNVGLEAYINVL